MEIFFVGVMIGVGGLLGILVILAAMRENSLLIGVDDDDRRAQKIGSRFVVIVPESVYVKMRTEILRLKQGNFTEEEFQNLCHRFDDEDEARFKAGCEQYQRKLFGRS